MSNKEMKMAVLVADAFQDSEFFLPKVEIEKAGIKVEIVSINDRPVDIWSFFDKIGELSVDKTIDNANPDDYVGILIPGGAGSPGTLSENEAVRDFVNSINERGKLVASICRGALLVAKSGVAKGKNITGFYDPELYPDLAIRETVKELGGIWHDDLPVVIDDNLISSRHPNDADEFTEAITNWLKP